MTFDMEVRFAQVKARRVAAGLVAKDGTACPTQAWVDYHDAVYNAPREVNGKVLRTPALTALRDAAFLSTAQKA